MRIERRIATLIAVLCGVLSTATAEPEQTPVETEWSNSSRVRRTPQPQAHYHPHPHRHPVQEEPVTDKNGSWKKTAWQNMQTLLRKEGYAANGSQPQPVECCPVVLEMVEPKGGRNQEGLYVELYSNGENKQRFYESSCRQDIVNQPCRFIEPRLHNHSKCVQKFSYTYALVKDPAAATEAPHRHRRGERHFPALPGGGGWSLDYIRVRAGCSCEVTPPPKKRKRQDRHRLRKVKGKRPHEVEDDET